MSKSVIKVKNLSKRYRLGLKEKQAKTLSGQIGNLIKSPWENLKRLREMSRFGIEDESIFWAIKDINFEVKEGEVLGIIGKNGAGKSTLLKVLSQITEPTTGKIEIQGRVASLLEVGTGFHPELSGRENIYMNGTILGMTRREIDAKLDEIIDFSGIEKFIDTPVKFYSSGMKVRLGFSVAAHLDPEILIIDEVLAVGDFEFQKKCLGKMEDVSKNQGRTVLFVSHNIQAVKNLCTKSILLEKGILKKIGDTDEVVSYYFNQAPLKDVSIFDLSQHPAKKFKNLGLLEASIFVNDQLSNVLLSNDTLRVKLKYVVLKEHLNIPMEVGFGLTDNHGQTILAFINKSFKFEIILKSLSGFIDISLPNFPVFINDTLNFSFYFGYLGDYFEVLDNAFKIQIKTSDYLGYGFPLDAKINSIVLRNINFHLS